MNIDERLETLTHSVELLAEMHKDNEKRMNRLGKYIRAVSQLVLDHETRHSRDPTQQRRGNQDES